MSIQLRSGTFVVLEGPDGTGKTTALMNVRNKFLQQQDGTTPLYTTRQPAGGTALGARIYTLEEEYGLSLTPLARQLLHIACHAEQYASHIMPWLDDGFVMMDRCWWSAVAYGFFGGSLHEYFDYESYEALVQAPACKRLPDLVFLFTEIHKPDPKNNDDVVLGYRSLAERYADTTVHIPQGLSTTGVAHFMVQTMRKRGLIK